METSDPAMKDQPAEGGVEQAEDESGAAAAPKDTSDAKWGAPSAEAAERMGVKQPGQSSDATDQGNFGEALGGDLPSQENNPIPPTSNRGS